MSRVRRWEPPPAPVPKHPYRDTVFVYAGMSVVMVLLGVVTGGGFVRALVVAVGFFVIATAWTWRRWRQRLRAKEARRP